MPVNGPALAAIAAGSIFMWSGVKGWSVLGTVGDVVSGKPPKGSEINPLVSGSSPGLPSGSTGNLASLALAHEGHIYKYGGAPGINGANPWDCSSFINWVVGHEARRAIPGYGPGKYNGTVHGPPTGGWGIWPGLRRISRSEVQSGDLIIWTLHMGMAISNTEMISATGPDGTPSTKRGTIDKGGSGFLMKYGRLIF